MTEERTPVGDSGPREQATIRPQKKSEFRAHLLAYVLFNAALVAIWVLTGASFFWPAIPLLIWGIGLVFHAWDVYRQPFSEEQIRREMQRMR
jgi:heme O synthase-like polyprenyltransferase